MAPGLSPLSGGVAGVAPAGRAASGAESGADGRGGTEGGAGCVMTASLGRRSADPGTGSGEPRLYCHIVWLYRFDVHWPPGPLRDHPSHSLETTHDQVRSHVRP